MKCPKCQFEQPEDQGECLACGLIFARYRARGEARDDDPVGAAEGAGPEPAALESTGTLPRLLFQVAPNPLAGGVKLGLVAVLAWFGLRLALAGVAGNAAGESFLHLVNLPFHEAGHLLFRPFPRLLTSLGGTLGQLLIPLICLAVLLLRTRDPFGAAVCAWWLGENFLDIAPYINDARSLSLPLLGGNTGGSAPYGFHDWEFVLTETGLLPYDHLLARTAHGFGAAVMVLALVWGGYLGYRQLRG